MLHRPKQACADLFSCSFLVTFAGVDRSVVRRTCIEGDPNRTCGPVCIWICRKDTQRSAGCRAPASAMYSKAATGLGLYVVSCSSVHSGIRFADARRAARSARSVARPGEESIRSVSSYAESN